MSKKTNLDPSINQCIIAEIPRVQAIYRYGSAFSIYERQDSDVDIAVLSSEQISIEQITRLSVALMKITGREIDLHDMRKLPVTLRVQIVMEGERIYGKDPAAAEAYETLTLSKYVRLNEERHQILKDIGKRAQIYG